MARRERALLDSQHTFEEALEVVAADDNQGSALPQTCFLTTINANNRGPVAARLFRGVALSHFETLETTEPTNELP